MAEVELREGLCVPTELTLMTPLCDSPPLPVSFSDLQGALLQPLYLPEAAASPAELSVPSSQDHLPCPSSLPPTPVLFESW